MKSDETENIERPEDFFVHAEFTVLGKKIDGVLCKVFLPEKINDKPILKLKPTKDQFQFLKAFHEGSFVAEIRGFNNNVEVTLEAPNVYFSNMKTKFWGKDFSESSLSGEPQHLHIIRYLNSQERPQRTSLTMWLSPNPMLGPAMTVMHHFNGNVQIERIRQLELDLSSSLKVKFDKHFRHKELKKDKTIHWSYLVACLDSAISAMDLDTLKDKVLLKMDALLTIASLGSRTRTACVGWQASDHQVLTEYYRGDFTFPTGQSEPSFDQGLVSLKDFEAFLSSCYPAFLKHQNQESLRKAIFSVIPGRKKVLEESFLSLFAGLESLILDFRKNKKLEYAIDNNDTWKSIKNKIKKNIFKTIKHDLSKRQRCFIYSKLEDLNRIPLKIAFDEFCNTHELDFSDLWPLFRSDRTIGLSDIRNKLIHGDEFLSDYHDAFWVAEESLRFMLERILLKLLGWPIENSEVSKDFLRQHSVALQIMPKEQEKISKFFFRNDQAN